MKPGVHIGQGRVQPLLSLLVPTRGNSNKISRPLALVKTLAKAAKRPVRLLCDSWFMRRRLIDRLLKMVLHVLSQVRRDTALFLPLAPCERGPGWPRVYGERLRQENLPTVQYVLPLYGKALPVSEFATWRTREPVTAGWVAQWVRITFGGRRFRSGY